MRKISDIKDTGNSLLSLKGYISNCYWLPDDIDKAIQSEQLYETDAAGGFGWILVKEGRNQFFYQAHTDKTDSYECILPDHMELVSEIIYSARLSEKKEAERDILRRCGFRFSDTARMMSCKPSDSQMPSITGGVIRQADLQDKEAILSLFCSSFDRLTDAFPVGDELTEAILHHEMWVYGDSISGKVIGCAMIESSGRRSWIRHVTVNPAMRGKGIAKELLQTIIARGGPEKEYLLWVKQTNKAALSLYEKTGFADTTRQMDIWTKTDS